MAPCCHAARAKARTGCFSHHNAEMGDPVTWVQPHDLCQAFNYHRDTCEVFERLRGGVWGLEMLYSIKSPGYREAKLDAEGFRPCSNICNPSTSVRMKCGSSVCVFQLCHCTAFTLGPEAKSRHLSCLQYSYCLMLSAGLCFCPEIDELFVVAQKTPSLRQLNLLILVPRIYPN